jgi:type II secretory pathway pseudopilin PulG
MQKNKKKYHFFKRQFLTLLEMMVVITIIGMLIAALAYNYQGSLEKSKAFKTEAAMRNLQTILSTKAAEDPQFMDNIQSEWEAAVTSSPLVSNPRDILYDGWGNRFTINVDDHGGIYPYSPKYTQYMQRQGGNSH